MLYFLLVCFLIYVYLFEYICVFLFYATHSVAKAWKKTSNAGRRRSYILLYIILLLIQLYFLYFLYILLIQLYYTFFFWGEGCQIIKYINIVSNKHNYINISEKVQIKRSLFSATLYDRITDEYCIVNINLHSLNGFG